MSTSTVREVVAEMEEVNEETKAKKIKFNGIPEELKQYKNWVLWKFIDKNDGKKPTKMPFKTWKSNDLTKKGKPMGYMATSTNPEHWDTFENVKKAYEKGGYEGIGFVFGNTPYCGIDIDHCIDKDGIKPKAYEIIQKLNSWTEVSPSKTGIHTIIRAEKKVDNAKNPQWDTTNDTISGLEIYDTGRYFTMTGFRVGGTPATIEARQAELNEICEIHFEKKEKPIKEHKAKQSLNLSEKEIIEKAMKATNGSEFTRLYNGDISGNGNDHSSADLALCNILAFYTKDFHIIDSIFKSSSLYREKWDRQDYKSDTINKALSDSTGEYDPKYNDGKSNKSKTETKQTAPKIKKSPICGNDLMAMHLKPLEYIVDGILATSGVYLLAGASKMGKSWLGIDISIAVSNGTNILGKTTKQSSTLYIDLESSKRSIKSRLNSMYKNGINIPNWIYLDEFERIGAGFEEDLFELIKEKNIKLIVIDVFVKVRSVVQRGATEYQHDYSDLGVLKKIASEHEVCFLVVTHLRKMKDDDDVFNTMTGSTGLMGASDGALLLARKRGEDHAVLHIDGRDIRNDELALRWNKEATRWECMGKVSDVKEVFKKKAFIDSPLVKVLKKILDDNQGELIISPSNLFNKIFFDYSDIDGIPATPNLLGKTIKENMAMFHSVGIDVSNKGNSKKRLYKISRYIDTLDTLDTLDTDNPFLDI